MKKYNNLENLLSRTVKSGSCLIYTGPLDVKGYGFSTFKGKTFRVHRLVFQFVNGPIPKGMMVYHKCSNPSCINPKHLLAGTAKDNMQNMIKKGRANFRKKKEFCKYGHKLSGENVRLLRSGKRICNVCYQENIRNDKIRNRLRSKGMIYMHDNI